MRFRSMHGARCNPDGPRDCWAEQEHIRRQRKFTATASAIDMRMSWRESDVTTDSCPRGRTRSQARDSSMGISVIDSFRLSQPADPRLPQRACMQLQMIEPAERAAEHVASAPHDL